MKRFLQILCLTIFFHFRAIQGYLIFALFQRLLPRLILQLPGNSEFLCFEFILVVFERLYIFSPISVSDLSEPFATYFSQTFLMDTYPLLSLCLLLFYQLPVCIQPIPPFPLPSPFVFPFSVDNSISCIDSSFINGKSRAHLFCLPLLQAGSA